MRSYVGAFLLALTVAALLTPLVRRVALRLGAAAAPGGRHVHEQRVPRLGGLAIALAFSAPIASLFVIDTDVALSLRSHSHEAIAALAGASALCLLGAWDDTRGVRVSVKLLLQVCAAIAAFALGLRIDAIAIPFVGSVSMGVFALPVTVCWIVGVTNAVNLIDGLDGLAAGVAFFAALTNFVVAYVSGGTFVALFMASMMGAVVGFLFYNFNPARIFMGDSGSYFLGFILATMSLASVAQKASTTVALVVPMVALGVPIFDTLFSMLRRFLERRSIFSPDRGHLHHRLLELGLTHRRAVLILYSFSMVMAAAAIGISLGRAWVVGVALLSVTVVVFGLVRIAGAFSQIHLAARRRHRIYDELTQQLRVALPYTIGGLRAAETEQQIFEELCSLATQCNIRDWSLVSARGLRKEWQSGGGARDVLRVEFPVGDGAGEASGSFRVGVAEQGQEVSVQAEMLLQVLVDEVVAALVRQGSELVAAACSSDEASEETEQELRLNRVRA